MSERKKLIDKLTKMLAKAKGTNNAAEAETFMHKVHQLLEQHNISLHELGGSDDPIHRDDKELEVSRSLYYAVHLVPVLMAVRELESNTRDENGMSRLVDSDHRDTIVHDHTYIMIECPELKEAYENLGNIFLMDVEDPIIDNGIVQVYERSSKYIFYRGLRVRDLDKESLYTYNILSGFQLTEDRTDAYQWQTNQAILKVLVESDLSELHDEVLEADDTSFESTLDFDQLWTIPSSTWLGNVERRVRGNLPILSRAANYYNDKFREPSPDDVFSIEFTRAELEAIMDSDVDDDIAIKCKEALEDS